MRTRDIKQTIKEYFFDNSKARLRVREIERVLKLPLPSVIRYCKELEKEGILTIVKIGSVLFYSANTGDEKYILEKKLYNLRNIYESGIIESIKRELNNPAIVLFGSFSRGEDTEESDIDLYIETPSNKAINLDKFKKVLRKDIQIFRHKSLKEIPNHHLANNIINGIVLNNYLEVFTHRKSSGVSLEA